MVMQSTGGQNFRGVLVPKADSRLPKGHCCVRKADQRQRVMVIPVHRFDSSDVFGTTRFDSHNVRSIESYLRTGTEAYFESCDVP